MKRARRSSKFYDAGEPGEASAIVNISTRAQALTDDFTMIAGFVLTGTEQKKVLIRGAGPALSPLGVSGTLADPLIEVYDAKNGNAKIATNDSWSEDPTMASLLDEASKTTGAFAWSRDSKDAALLLQLPPGIYTVMLKGKGYSTGNAMIEVYEVR